MSAKDMETILGKAVCDQNYRNLLFKDPEKASIGFKLKAHEEKALKQLSPIFFEKAMNNLQTTMGIEMIKELRQQVVGWYPDPPG